MQKVSLVVLCVKLLTICVAGASSTPPSRHAETSARVVTNTTISLVAITVLLIIYINYHPVLKLIFAKFK